MAVRAVIVIHKTWIDVLSFSLLGNHCKATLSKRLWLLSKKVSNDGFRLYVCKCQKDAISQKEVL